MEVIQLVILQKILCENLHNMLPRKLSKNRTSILLLARCQLQNLNCGTLEIRRLNYPMNNFNSQCLRLNNQEIIESDMNIAKNYEQTLLDLLHNNHH